jgi:catechol 2,3-dioxygenase-like lactoylglutathione lyase family enzyme
MLDHTGIVVTDLPKARKFYDAVAKALGLGIVTPHKDFFLLGRGPKEIPYLWIGTLRPSYWIEGSRAGVNQMHVAFAAKDNATVDEFYRATLAAGGRDVTTASRGRARRATTARSCSIRTGTTSRRFLAPRAMPGDARDRHAASRRRGDPRRAACRATLRVNVSGLAAAARWR